MAQTRAIEAVNNRGFRIDLDCCCKAVKQKQTAAIGINSVAVKKTRNKLDRFCPDTPETSASKLTAPAGPCGVEPKKTTNFSGCICPVKKALSRRTFRTEAT